VDGERVELGTDGKISANRQVWSAPTMTHPTQRNFLILAVAMAFACVSAAQQPARVELPHFDVASIKAEEPGVPRMMGVHVHPGGRVEIAGLPLKSLIATAFDLGFWQISGGEGWVSKDTYFVEANPPDALRSHIKSFRYTLFGIDDPLIREMLQALLIDRFQLKFHRAIKAGDVYLLKRNEKPLPLNPANIPAGASESNSFGSIGYVDGKWSIFATTMSQLARFASGTVLRAPVQDQTGLTGSFDYRQRQPDLEPQYDSDPSHSFKAFLAGAGLTLERSKGQVEEFVIDYAGRPTPN
jgi:uncharacterized protein (TIGR03435 family)